MLSSYIIGFLLNFIPQFYKVFCSCDSYVSSGTGLMGSCDGDILLEATSLFKCQYYCTYPINNGYKCYGYTYDTSNNNCYLHKCDTVKLASSTMEYFKMVCPETTIETKDITTTTWGTTSTSSETTTTSTNEKTSTPSETITTFASETTSTSTETITRFASETISTPIESTSTAASTSDTPSTPASHSTTTTNTDTTITTAITLSETLYAFASDTSSTASDKSSTASYTSTTTPSDTTLAVGETTSMSPSETKANGIYTTSASQIENISTTASDTSMASTTQTNSAQSYTTSKTEATNMPLNRLSPRSICSYPSDGLITDRLIIEEGLMLCGFHYRKQKKGSLNTSNGLVFNEQRISSIQCSSRCANYGNCKSFYFDKNTRICQGFSVYLDPNNLDGRYQLGL